GSLCLRRTRAPSTHRRCWDVDNRDHRSGLPRVGMHARAISTRDRYLIAGIRHEASTRTPGRLRYMAERSWSFSKAFRNLFTGPELITEDTWDDLEAALITADFGPEVSESILDQLRA